jgi:uncharacterized protein YwgA
LVSGRATQGREFEGISAQKDLERMHIQDLILLVIGSEREKSLRGRATLQKILYFLSGIKKTNLDIRACYYGPYSSWVSDNLDILGETMMNEIKQEKGYKEREEPLNRLNTHP